jgi:hypothetical protein
MENFGENEFAQMCSNVPKQLNQLIDPKKQRHNLTDWINYKLQ